jgi:hypothetical protein
MRDTVEKKKNSGGTGIENASVVDSYCIWSWTSEVTPQAAQT